MRKFVAGRQAEGHPRLHLTDKEADALHTVRGWARVVGRVGIRASDLPDPGASIQGPFLLLSLPSSLSLF